MIGGTPSCQCPELYHETCHTTAEWKLGCANFPAPPPGQQCPSAEAFGNACEAEVPGEVRVTGDKCCYKSRVPCY